MISVATIEVASTGYLFLVSSVRVITSTAPGGHRIEGIFLVGYIASLHWCSAGSS